MSEHHETGLRLAEVGLLMVIFGGFELVVAINTNNPLILADAVHNLADAITPMILAVISFIAHASLEHAKNTSSQPNPKVRLRDFLECRLPKGFALFTLVLTFLLIVAAPFLEFSDLSDLSRGSLIATVFLALGGAAVNAAGHWHLHSDGLAQEKSMERHLKVDIQISFVIAITAAILISPVVAILLGIGVVAIRFVTGNWDEARHMWNGIHFRKPHRPEHDDHHGHHHPHQR